MAIYDAKLSNIKKALLSCSYVAIWIILSFAVIISNNYILDPKLYNRPFPILLAMIHMSFCSSVSFILVRVARLMDPPSMPPKLYVSSVVPIGALYSLSLWFSNSVYMYLSASSVQMLRVLVPVIVYCISILFKKETFKSSVMTDMLTIGILFGEVHFVAFESTQLVLIQILVTSKGISLNPITSLHYVAPCCLAFLLIPWTFVELPVLMKYSSFNIDFFVFGTNLMCAFALNLAVFLLVGNMSPLTINVAGVLKDWLLIALSWSVIRDTVTMVNLIGYMIAFSGVAFYNYVKLHAKAEKKVVLRGEGGLHRHRDVYTKVDNNTVLCNHSRDREQHTRI